LPDSDDLTTLPQVTLLPLDVTDSKNVREVAAEIGGKVDILVNNAEYHRAYGIANRPGIDTARAEMDVNYFGLLRLAQEFGPAMRGRGADGLASATAWVNVLSIYALANFPSHGTFSASKAAAHSLSQCLRAEMRPAGVRVINVFPGPLDDEWNQLLPPPKIAPATLASAVVKALREGVADLYPGDVAQEWLARARDNPTTMAKEVSHYDERGPAWYWNNFSCGEHTGTHFDAPIHWVSGKDLPNNAVDSIPPERFIGPAFVVDCSKQAVADADFLLTKEFLLKWEK